VFARLPSEAEWEYACRAGSTSEFYFGDDKRDLRIYAWFRENSEEGPFEVATRKPNPWGLFDMHGSAEEWCEDIYNKSILDAPTDGSAWTAGGEDSGVGTQLRILRGGHIFHESVHCRSAFRNADRPTVRDGGSGFRPVFTPTEDE